MSIAGKPFMTPEKMDRHAEILSNRVRTRFRHLSRRFRKQDIECFRLYDWDIPEVRAVVDWYAGHVVMAEYERTQTSKAWLPKMAKALVATLDIPLENIHLKRRHTGEEGVARYSKMTSKAIRLKVKERDLKLWVNVSDFLDTGLFSDHRNTRVIIGKLAKDTEFLNLYGYTGAFSCVAALAGAKKVVTVDRSETYLKWAQDNFKLNGIPVKGHEFVRSDVQKYLLKTAKLKKKFTLAFVDPPSFFQDRSTKVSFDINRDHPTLLREVFKVMAPNALVFFSTNHQRFEPVFKDLPVKDLKELTPKTIPEDYRNQNIHSCWQMRTL